MPSDIENRTLEILSELCNVSREDLTPEVHLVKDLGLDSAVTLDLLITLEEELGRDISELEAAKLVTVGDVLRFVEQHGGAETCRSEGA